jgi:hypothetical protein
MADADVKRLNEFARSKHAGTVGVEILTCELDLVTGRMPVTAPVVAHRGRVSAPCARYVPARAEPPPACRRLSCGDCHHGRHCATASPD